MRNAGAGEKIGECGNSGRSTEAHLHFHVQDNPSFYVSASKIIHRTKLRRNDTVIALCANLTRVDRLSDASRQFK